MVLNQKPTGRAISIPAGLAMGAGINLGTMLIMAALIAKLVEGERIGETNIGYGVMVMLIVAAFLGAFTASRKIKRQRFLVCTLSGVLYFGILLGITALFFGGQYEAVGVTCLLVMCGAMLAVFAQDHTKGKRKSRMYRKTNR